MNRNTLVGTLLFSLSLQPASIMMGQTAQLPTSAAGAVERAAAGDSPDNPGPLARSISKAITTTAIQAAMRKVADWQLRTGESRFNQQWTFAPLYDGLLAASATTGDPRYSMAVERASERFDWSLVSVRFPHADDQALGLAYLTLYQQHPSPKKIADVQATMDRLIARTDTPDKNLWWWCDALFMAPPVLARLSQITGDPKYVRYLDHEWQLTSQSLYDPGEHLFYRDDRYFTRKEANGAKLFWSRGNGWVLAGLAMVIETLPTNDPMRPKFVTQFQALAERVLSLQGPDGLWRSGLLDPQSYTAPEISGSAFFTYAMAWGVNNGLLDRKRFEPAITRSWAGLIDHIYEDGRLGSIQPIDAAPGAFKPSSSYVYGVGAFLLAGSQLNELATTPPARNR